MDTDDVAAGVAGFSLLALTLAVYFIGLMAWAWVLAEYWVWFAPGGFDVTLAWKDALGCVMIISLLKCVATSHLARDEISQTGSLSDRASRILGRNFGLYVILPPLFWLKGWIVYSVFF